MVWVGPWRGRLSLPRQGRWTEPTHPHPAQGDLRWTESVRSPHPRTHSSASPSVTGAMGQGLTPGATAPDWALSFGQGSHRKNPHLGRGLAAVAVEGVELLVKLVVEFRVPFPGVHHLLGATGRQRRCPLGQHREPAPHSGHSAPWVPTSLTVAGSSGTRPSSLFTQSDGIGQGGDVGRTPQVRLCSGAWANFRSGLSHPLTTHIHTALTSKSRSEYRSFFLWKEQQGGREGEESLLPHAGAAHCLCLGAQNP